MKIKNKGGRPKKFTSPKVIEKLAEDYFNRERTGNRPLTITGLAMALGMTRKGLLEYENDPTFGNTVKKIKSEVERFNETVLYTRYSTGAIFNLKVNFGWRDPHDLEMQKTVGETLDKIAELLK